MVARPFVQAMSAPFPETGSYEDLASEMVMHCQVPQEKEADMVALFHSVADDVSAFKLISNSHFEGLMVCLALGDDTKVRVKQILGTVLAPHCFPDVQVPHTQTPSTTQTSTPTTTSQQPRAKGGAQVNSGEVLQPSRPAMSDYFPPPIFDIHRVGSPWRDEGALRLMIPQEVRRRTMPCHTLL